MQIDYKDEESKVEFKPISHETVWDHYFSSDISKYIEEDA